MPNQVPVPRRLATNAVVKSCQNPLPAPSGRAGRPSLRSRAETAELRRDVAMFVPEIARREFRYNDLKLLRYDRQIESCAANGLPNKWSIFSRCMQGS